MLIYLALSVKICIEVYKPDPYKPGYMDQMFLLAPAALQGTKDDCRLCCSTPGVPHLSCAFIFFVIFSTKGETVRYPRVKQFAHFHYDHVEFDTIQVRLT